MRPPDETDAASGERLSLLASIVESSGVAIIAKTLDGIITSWNPAAEKMYGYSSEEMIGKSISVMTHGDRSDEMSVILGKIRDGQRFEHLETVRVRKDGVAIPVSLTVSPIHNADGAVVAASSIARDVTEQKQASQYARSLIEASLDPLVTISVEGKITDVNEATIKVTGVAREGLVGTDFSDYFTEPDKAREGYQRVFAEGSVTDYPLTIRHRDGSLTDVLYNASVYRDAEDNVLGVFAAARDVTEQKHAQGAIAEQQAKELERAVYRVPRSERRGHRERVGLLFAGPRRPGRSASPGTHLGQLRAERIQVRRAACTDRGVLCRRCGRAASATMAASATTIATR